MRRRTRLATALACAVTALIALIWLLLRPATAPSRTPIAWRLQPDSYPLGTLHQGSQVEMSLGVFSGMKPAPMPAFLTSLPSPLKKLSEWTVSQYRDWAARLGLNVRIEAPAFVKVERTEVTSHSSQGPFVTISFRLITDSPGDCRGNLVVRLKGGAYGVTNLLVPVSARIVAAPGTNARPVLITETPYECYATGDGKDFEPLATLNRRLSERGVKVDFCRHLPRNLNGYGTILLAGSEMARLDSAQTKSLRQFVAGGGRLILAANAFFVPTVPKANTLLNPYGLQIVDRDAGWAVTNAQVVPDILTEGIKHVDFHRPSLITVTDPSQGKLFVFAGDAPGGFMAVSRQGGRGEVLVLTQSLWWTWIGAEPSKADNLLLLENLLVR